MKILQERCLSLSSKKTRTPALTRIVAHARTLRKAREQVKLMVITGFSARQIKRYLHQWIRWWVRTSESWRYQDVILWFLQVCRDTTVANYATDLLQQHRIKNYTGTQPLNVVQSDFVTALTAPL